MSLSKCGEEMKREERIGKGTKEKRVRQARFWVSMRECDRIPGEQCLGSSRRRTKRWRLHKVV